MDQTFFHCLIFADFWNLYSLIPPPPSKGIQSEKWGLRSRNFLAFLDEIWIWFFLQKEAENTFALFNLFTFFILIICMGVNGDWAHERFSIFEALCYMSFSSPNFPGKKVKYSLKRWCSHYIIIWLRDQELIYLLKCSFPCTTGRRAAFRCLSNLSDILWDWEEI